MTLTTEKKKTKFEGRGTEERNSVLAFTLRDKSFAVIFLGCSF